MYKPSRVQPTEGRFTAIWTYNNGVWSDNFEVRDGKLYTLNEDTDSFDKSSDVPNAQQENVIYIQLAEE